MYLKILNSETMLFSYFLDPCSTVERFEANLDKLWRDQELLYNYRASIQHNAAYSDTTTTMQTTFNAEPDTQA